jgi:Fe-S cluster assembly protein SufD
MATDTLVTISLGKEKQAAMDRFLAKGFPTNKWEEWKYASLKSLNDVDWNWNTSEAPAPMPSLDLDTAMLVQTLNGKFSIQSDLPQGIEILEFDAFAQQNPNFIARWLHRNPILDQNSLYDLNEALTSSHQVIWVKAGTILDRPILHQYVADVSLASAIQSKVLIYLEKGASLTWVDDLSTVSSSESILSNYVQEIWVEESAQLTFVKTQDFALKTTHIDHTFIFQQGNSQVDMFTFSINGGFVRNNLHFYVDGENVLSNLNGLYVPGNNEFIDSHTVVDHRKPNCESNELYKGVLLGNSTGVFNGKIFVRPDAQKTNAFQSCKNVLASDKATMNTKPQLEIWADDVKCSHGTTTGQLSDEALFYMRSRGISEEAAKTLLMLAFVQQVIDKVEIPALRESISNRVVAKIQLALGV